MPLVQCGDKNSVPSHLAIHCQQHRDRRHQAPPDWARHLAALCAMPRTTPPKQREILVLRCSPYLLQGSLVQHLDRMPLCKECEELPILTGGDILPKV